jgi:hypothetical protein
MLLIDAGATLNEEDIGTLRLLCEAAIPAIVLLSKSDLLADGDIQRITSYIHQQLQQELGLEVSVHPVSSLPEQSGLLDDFFDHELLPRFNEARSLRASSAARKIGALREAVTAAFETALDHKNRCGRGLPADAQDLEGRLRLVTGEVGEQRTVLDHAFFALGETPETILNQTAESALSWIEANSTSRVTAAQLSDWLYAAVRESVARVLETARSAAKRAIDTLQAVAREMSRSDMPQQDELEGLLRDVPRFELQASPHDVNLTVWMLLGTSVARARIRSNLRESIGAELKQALHLYGSSLSQWSNHFVSRLVLLINSHAEAYRVQLHRIAGNSTDHIDMSQLEHDLTTLRTWTAKVGSVATVQHG